MALYSLPPELNPVEHSGMFLLNVSVLMSSCRLSQRWNLIRTDRPLCRRTDLHNGMLLLVSVPMLVFMIVLEATRSGFCEPYTNV